MVMTYQPMRQRGYSVNQARMEQVRADAWAFHMRARVPHLEAQGASRADAERIANVEAIAYADRQVKRFAYIGVGFWVALVLAVPSAGLSLLLHFAWWQSKRRVLLAMPAPLEGLSARQVLR